MTIKVLLFGITTDLLGTSNLDLEIPVNSSIADFKQNLLAKYPVLENINSYAIAVNESYASDTDIIKENDVVAIIPPVSGG